GVGRDPAAEPLVDVRRLPPSDDEHDSAAGGDPLRAGPRAGAHRGPLRRAHVLRGHAAASTRSARAATSRSSSATARAPGASPAAEDTPRIDCRAALYGAGTPNWRASRVISPLR